MDKRDLCLFKGKGTGHMKTEVYMEEWEEGKIEGNKGRRGQETEKFR